MVVVLLSLSGCGADKKTVEALEARVITLEQKVASLQNSGTSTSATGPATTTASATAAAPQGFADVDSTIPTADMINDLTQLKVFEGTANGAFNPTQPVTRGEYVTWLYHGFNAVMPPEKQIRMSPAYKYVQALSNAGFSVGYDNKTFKPDQPLTREEMLAIKQGINGVYTLAADYVEFSDRAQIDKRFYPAINVEYRFNKEGPKGGDINRAFGAIKALKPKEPVLRYEAAATLWQIGYDGTYTAGKALGRDK